MFLIQERSFMKYETLQIRIEEIAQNAVFSIQ